MSRDPEAERYELQAHRERQEGLGRTLYERRRPDAPKTWAELDERTQTEWILIAVDQGRAQGTEPEVLLELESRLGPNPPVDTTPRGERVSEPDKTVTAQDLAAARDVLWPGREAALASWPLSDDERQLEVRVAQALADLSADAEDAWRHAREAERDLEQLRGGLTPTARQQATADLVTGDLMVRASLLVSEAFNAGVGEGEKRATVHPDEQLDPEAVRKIADVVRED